MINPVVSYKTFKNIANLSGSKKEAVNVMKELRNIPKTDKADAIETVTDMIKKLNAKFIKIKSLGKNIIGFDAQINNGNLNIVVDKTKNEVLQTQTSKSITRLPAFLMPYCKKTLITKGDCEGNIKKIKEIVEMNCKNNNTVPDMINTIMSNELTNNTYQQIKCADGTTEYFKKTGGKFVQLFRNK